MIDIHSHILPGIDDGAADMEESLALARDYVQKGYTRVVATPHFVFGSSWTPAVEKIQAALADLRRAMAAEGLRLEVLPGMEISLSPEIPRLLAAGRLMSLGGGPYVLVEPPFQRLPLGWDQVLFELTANGRRVLLAHPERCGQLLNEPDLFEELVQAGVYVQVNWSSFVGLYGREIQELACDLAARGLIHCLASDCHGLRQRQMSCLREAAGKVRKLVGRQSLKALAEDNPQRVVRGEALAVVQGRRKQPKRWWGWLRR